MIDFLKRLVLRNSGTKALAVVLGFFVWYHFSNEITDKITIQVQPVVKVENEAGYWILTEGLNKPVTITIEGPRRALDKIAGEAKVRPRSVTIIVSVADLKKMKTFPTKVTRRITKTGWLPDEVKVVEDYTSVEIEIDEVDTRPIAIRIVKKKKSDRWRYHAAADKVRVTAPLSRFKNLVVETLEVGHESVKKGHKVQLKPIRIGGRLVKFDPEEGVTISATKPDETKTMTFEDVEVTLRASPEITREHTIKFDANGVIKKLVLKVPKDSNVRKEDIDLFVNVNKDTINITSTSPQSVTIRIKVKGVEKVKVVGTLPKAEISLSQ